MRLAMITQDFPPDIGGTQRYALELANRLAASCGDFLLLAPDIPGGSSFDAELDFEVQRVGGSYNLHWYHAYRRLSNLRATRPFDAVLHIQWSTALLTNRLRNGSRPIPNVIIAHGRELLFNPFSGGPLNAAYQALRRSVLSRSAAIVAISDQTATIARRLAAATPVTIVYNGTDPEKMKPDPSVANPFRRPGQRIILSMSRLVYRKGVDLLIRALPAVRARVGDVRLLVAGAGPEEAALHELANETEVRAHVDFVGATPPEGAARYYNMCDVFAMCARESHTDIEGFGLVYLEANACLKPVVGSRVGGVPSAIVDGETGFLVDAEDVGQISDALSRILLDDELARRMGEAGRRRVVEYYNWDRIHDEVLALLKSKTSLP